MHESLADRRKCGYKGVSIVTFVGGSLQVENSAQLMLVFEDSKARECHLSDCELKLWYTIAFSCSKNLPYSGRSSRLGGEISVKHYQPPADRMWTTALSSTTDGRPPCKVGRTEKCTRRHQLMHMNRPGALTPAPSMTVPMAHSSRPTLGFPLGTALLLLVIFSLSGIFSCCYHWDRLRLLWSRHPAMLEEGQLTVISIGSAPSKATSQHKKEKAAKECGLPVIMPGDNIAKFFARPCPHETCLPAAEKAEVEVQVRCSVS